MTNLRQHRVLLIGFDDGESLRVVSMLGSFDVDFHRVPWNDSVAGIVNRSEFDAIVCPSPEDPQKLTRFLAALRSEGSASRHAGVVVLGEEHEIDDTRQLLGRGVNRVASLDDMGEALRDSVLSLLDVAHRFPVKVLVQLSAEIEAEPKTVFCNTENVSMSGMLVSCSTRFPVGAPFQFSLSFPGEDLPIRGTAEVARLTDPRRERGVLGMGASFIDFSEDHRSRLRHLLAQNVH